MSQHEAARAELEAQLARLLRRVGRIEGDLRRAHDRDWPEQAIELENDDVVKGLDEMTLAEIRRIRTALGRIADGSYGRCSACGQPIGADRMTAMPSAITCLSCSTGEGRRA